ncbi:hypothetical protein [Blastococcus sp. SYSU D00820]
MAVGVLIAAAGAFAEGDVVLGWVLAALAVLGGTCGAAGLVLALRRR